MSKKIDFYLKLFMSISVYLCLSVSVNNMPVKATREHRIA